MAIGKVKFVTLGCKVNQYETQGMREALERCGVHEPSSPDEPCELVIINTCTVTAEADRNNRYWIRRLRRDYPRAQIVVTGCYAERDAGALQALSEVDLVIPHSEKSRIAQRLSLRGSEPEFVSDRATFAISRFQNHSRAVLKIQDGCNHACSYCKVVLVRGRSRSRPFREIIDEAKRLRDGGYAEIILTGIQLGAYGLDLEKKSALIKVLEACSRLEGIERIRLSSIEPVDVTGELIRTVRDVPKCCPHLHIPLQSGDDRILKAMNRRYSAVFYEGLIERLRGCIPDFTLTLDVMPGFPGEEEEQFLNTVRLLETVRPLKCHVFPYSRRPGTRAARMGHDVSGRVLRDRAKRLICLQEQLGAAEKNRFTGEVFGVLVEETPDKKGWLEGFTPNYIRVSFPGSPSLAGKIVPVRLLKAQGHDVIGRLCG